MEFIAFVIGAIFFVWLAVFLRNRGL